MIRRDWVEKYVNADRALALQWAARSENAAHVMPVFRHILVRVPDDAPASDAAGKRKAEAILERLRRGADFAAVAAETSDDPGSVKNGGAYPGESVAHFVDPVRDAYDRLSPGETSAAPVRSVFGWHVVRKDAVTDDAKVAAYRRETAAVRARALAADVLLAFRRSDTTAQKGVDDAVAKSLGESAASDADRPKAEMLRGDTPRASLSLRCARILDAGPQGEVEETADDVLTVSAAAGAQDSLPPSAEPSPTCRRSGQLTEAQMAELVARLKELRDGGAGAP